MTPSFQNHVRAFREARQWSQADLATRVGISRTGLGAIEAGRLVPSTATALALAQALACRVEDLFSLAAEGEATLRWAIPPRQQPVRFWQARVGSRWLAYPSDAVADFPVWQDGVFRGGRFEHSGLAAAEAALGDKTLVVASCDPAAGLLASEYVAQTPFRLLVVRRSSREALRLLADGLVHAAGVHLGRAGEHGNAAVCREMLGPEYMLMRMARWQEGLALSPGVKARSLGGVVRSRARWIGREAGSGARVCLDELLGDAPPPRRIAHDHRGVATAIRDNWADVGVCLRLACEEYGLSFLPVREEDYDLCIASQALGDPRIEALVRVVRSAAYRRHLGELPGYDSSATGELEDCAKS
ncbi:MAG: helix-turn-helix domain-containing protein [Pirellulales bacterium]|nr:helix-turn-helix domain-containing protein [Pirellulales bacterium]